MTTTSSSSYDLPERTDIQFANKTLKVSAASWLLTAVMGQWLFAYYILVFYGGSAVQGDWSAWTNRMIHGFIEGDLIGNIAVFVHIVLAFVITFCGPLQFIPQIRSKFPTIHRWNGRAYIITALIISPAAIYMIWSRESVIGGVIGQIATSLDAVLIMISAVMTVRYAKARQFKVHSRWALRLFIVVSGVWFFRVMRGFWMFVHEGTSPGTNGTLTGPFDITLNFFGYLFPLLMLEIYFRVKDNGTPRAQYILASTIFVLTGALAIGIYSAAHIFWLPRI